MTKDSGLNYAERNALIPLCDLSSTGSDSIERFQGGQSTHGNKVAGEAKEPSPCLGLLKEIRAAGMKPEHFYFNPANNETPWVYWRGVVLLNLPSLEGEVRAVKATAERMEKEINDSVARRDFDRFLDQVDARLAPELFMEVFNNIPDHDKFRLFERLWRFNQYAHDIFPPDFARKAYQYRKVNRSLPPLDSTGYVRVFISPAAGIEPHLAENWTTNLNRALRAASSIPAPPIYQGWVHPDHINSYDGGHMAGKVLVKPGTVEGIRSMDLIDLADFETELNEVGIISQYRCLAGQIDAGWFHKPEGIHAIDHTRRVLILSMLLAYLERFSPTDRDLLARAAIYHDIGRVDDGYDPGHGQASYARTCRECLVQWTNPEENEIFRFIVENHDLPDSKAYQRVHRYELEEIDRTLRLYNTFKDADGLDRVRLGDLNPDYLRTASAPRLLLVAHQIYFQPYWLERHAGW
mgnify:FL=1